MCGCRKGSATLTSTSGSGLRASTPLIYGEDDIELPVRRATIIVPPEGTNVPSGAQRWVRGTGVDAAEAAGDIIF